MYEDFMKLIKERCSVRKFMDKAVDSKNTGADFAGGHVCTDGL